MRLLILVDLDNIVTKLSDRGRFPGWKAPDPQGLPRVPEPAPVLVPTRTATVVVAANSVTDARVFTSLRARGLPEVPSRGGAFAEWLNRYASAFAAHEGAALDAVEYAMVPSAPEAADVALELLVASTPGEADEGFDMVVLFSQDQTLEKHLTTLIGAGPTSAPGVPLRPQRPVRWGRELVRRGTPRSVAPADVPPLPPAGDPRRFQWLGPSRTGVMGVARMGALLRGETPLPRGAGEVFVRRPPQGGTPFVRSSAAPGTYEVGQVHVLTSQLPLSVLQAWPRRRWNELPPRELELNDDAVLACFGADVRADRVVSIEVELRGTLLLAEVEGWECTFQEEWWRVYDERGSRRATVKLRVTCPPQAAQPVTSVYAVAMPRPAELEVWWIAVEGALLPEPGGLALRRGLATSPGRLILSHEAEDRYEDGFVPLQAPGVQDEVRAWGLNLPVPELLPLPVIVPVQHVSAALRASFSPHWCPIRPAPGVSPAEPEAK